MRKVSDDKARVFQIPARVVCGRMGDILFHGAQAGPRTHPVTSDGMPGENAHTLDIGLQRFDFIAAR